MLLSIFNRFARKICSFLEAVMKDACAREITYLRLSVTDLCDLRCRYCMPPEGVPKRPHKSGAKRS